MRTWRSFALLSLCLATIASATVWLSAAQRGGRPIDIPKVFRVPLEPSSGKSAGAPIRVGLDNSDREGSPSWSPDGRELAFATGSIISIVSSDTGQRREVHPDLDWVRSVGLTTLSWSPDRRFLLIDGGTGPDGTARPKGAYRVDASTGEATMVVSKPVNPASVSLTKGLPNGHAVIYLDKWQAVVVRDLEAGDERILYEAGTSLALDSLALSPDGQSAAFRAHGKGDVDVLSLAGGPPRTVVTIRGPRDPAAAVTWSADGGFLIYSHQETKDGPFGLWRVGVAGGTPERLGLESNTEISAVVARPGGRELAVVMRVPAASNASSGAR